MKRKSLITKLLLIISLFLLFRQPGVAQLSAIHAYNRCDSIILINEFNETLKFPFAGGLNSCQFANIDLNLDGIDDLIVFDRHGNRLLPFVVNPFKEGNLEFAPEFATLFPPLEHWMQLLDYDGDGENDIFTYTTGGIKVFRNISANSLKFEQVTFPYLLSQQGSTLTNILVTYADYPAIADVDADGDLDILTFWGLGSFVEWHRNTSIELYGNRDSLNFEKSSSCWGRFAEGNEDNTIKLDTCVAFNIEKRLPLTKSDDPKHTGSTLLANDLNGDGLMDLTIGDVDFGTLVHLTNGGTSTTALMTAQTTHFPDAEKPVNISTFPAAMLADVNYDGKKDLLVSPFDPSLGKSENFKSCNLYLNTGTNSVPAYVFSTESFLQEQMLDLGSGAYPVFFDYNSDGLMDLLVGNYGYCDTCIFLPATGLQCTYNSSLALLINTGTKEKPSFRLVDRNVAHLDTLEMQSLIPTVADMDGDADADLVCGNSKGKLVYFENMAQVGQAADFKLVDPAWYAIDVGDFSAPQLIDLDNDNLIDLVCGKRNGTISFYKNSGTSSSPQFTLITENLGSVDVTNPQLSNYGYSTPCFTKDSKGGKLLFAGSEFGDLFVYDQIDNNLNGNFRLLGTIPGIKEGWRAGVALGNLNDDTLSDMAVGNYSGGLGLFIGKPDKLFGSDEVIQSSLNELIITPNPATSETTISLNVEKPEKAISLLLMDVQGRIVKQYSNVGLPLKMDISGCEAGVYILKVIAAKGYSNGKMVVLR